MKIFAGSIRMKNKSFMSIHCWLSNVHMLKSKFTFKTYRAKDLFVIKIYPLMLIRSNYFSDRWQILLLLSCVCPSVCPCIQVNVQQVKLYLIHQSSSFSEEIPLAIKAVIAQELSMSYSSFCLLRRTACVMWK